MKLDDCQKIQTILSQTILALCNNGFEFDCELEVHGLLGITLDKKDVHLVKISEVIRGEKTALSLSPSSKAPGKDSLELQAHSDNSINVPAKRLCTQSCTTNRSPKRKKPEDDDDDNSSPQDLSQRTHSPSVKQELFADSHRDSPAAAAMVRVDSQWKNNHPNMEHDDNITPKTAAHASSPSRAPSSSLPAAAATMCTPKRSMPCVAAWNSPGFVAAAAAGDGRDSPSKPRTRLSRAEMILAENGHFPSRLPPKRTQQNATGQLSMQKRCRVCYRTGMRKETIYCCPQCSGMPGLCSGRCFAVYHGLLYDDNQQAFTPPRPTAAAILYDDNQQAFTPPRPTAASILCDDNQQAFTPPRPTAAAMLCAGRTDMETMLSATRSIPLSSPAHCLSPAKQSSPLCLFPSGPLLIKEEPVDIDAHASEHAEPPDIDTPTPGQQHENPASNH